MIRDYSGTTSERRPLRVNSYKKNSTVWVLVCDVDDGLVESQTNGKTLTCNRNVD